MNPKFEIEILQKHGVYVREIMTDILDTLTQLEQSCTEEPVTPNAETTRLLEVVAELLIRLTGEVGMFDRRLLEIVKKLKTDPHPS